jgi:hypothetical protein
MFFKFSSDAASVPFFGGRGGRGDWSIDGNNGYLEITQHFVKLPLFFPAKINNILSKKPP